MKKKTRNYIITFAVISLLLMPIFLSVWDYDYELKGSRQPGKPMDYGQPGDSLIQSSPKPLHLKFTFSGPFPEDITRGMPSIVADIKNISKVSALVSLNQISLKKTDFKVTGQGKGTEAASFKVIPFEFTDGQGNVLMMKPGEMKRLEYRISDYFFMYPGTSEIRITIGPGAVQAGSLTNEFGLTAARKVTVKKGSSIPALLAGKGVSGPRTVAYVNGMPIHEEVFLEELKEVHGWELLQKLIAEKAVWEELEKQNVKVTPEDTAYALEFEKRTFNDQAPDVPFKTYLETKGMSEKELAQSKGFLLRIAIRKYLMSGAKKPSENDLMKFFRRKYHWYGREEMVRAQKIVVRPDTKEGKVSPGKAREDALATLLTIRKEIVDGRITFDKAVEGLSQDVRARVSSGNMDPFRVFKDEEGRNNDVPQRIADVAFRLKPGEISTPLEGEDGEFLILKVIGRIPAKHVVFADVRETVGKDFLYNSITGEVIQQWIQRLLNSGKIEVTREYNEIFSREQKLDNLKHFESGLIKDQ